MVQSFPLPVGWSTASTAETGIAAGIRAVNPDPDILDELVRRTVESVHPLRIILFGSAARGAMGPRSDLDALVVMPDQSDCRGVAKLLVRRLRDLGCSADIVVVRKSDIEREDDNRYPDLHTALTEGRELYRSAS
jgi:predicted nucleotidyltransferase